MPEIRRYAEMTSREICRLDRSRTVFLLPLSPLEAHGPHLPVGADVMVAREMARRYGQLVAELSADHIPVQLPALTLGADVLDRPGSVGLPPRTLQRVLHSYAGSFAREGFLYLFIADNHGGPRHLIACEAAARNAYRRWGFHLVNPFIRAFSLMLNADDEDISHFIGLDEGERGDLSDLHAGTNETSLLLRTRPEAVRDNYRQLSPQPAPAPAAAFAHAARVMTAFGMSDKAAQLRTLGSIISWSSQRDWPSYIGAPAEGSARAGEAMLQGRVQLAGEIFARVLQGESVPMTPPLWWLRLLRFLP